MVDTTLDSKGTVGAGVGRTVGVGARDGLVARPEVGKGAVELVDAQTVRATAVLG